MEESDSVPINPDANEPDILFTNLTQSITTAVSSSMYSAMSTAVTDSLSRSIVPKINKAMIELDKKTVRYIEIKERATSIVNYVNAVSAVNDKHTNPDPIPDIVKINAGGRIYEVSIETLKKRDTFISHLFSGRWHLALKDGVFYLDINHKIFEVFMDYHRTGQLPSITVLMHRGIDYKVFDQYCSIHGVENKIVIEDTEQNILNTTNTVSLEYRHESYTLIAQARLILEGPQDPDVHKLIIKCTDREQYHVAIKLIQTASRINPYWYYYLGNVLMQSKIYPFSTNETWKHHIINAYKYYYKALGACHALFMLSTACSSDKRIQSTIDICTINDKLALQMLMVAAQKGHTLAKKHLERIRREARSTREKFGSLSLNETNEVLTTFDVKFPNYCTKTIQFKSKMNYDSSEDEEERDEPEEDLELEDEEGESDDDPEPVMRYIPKRKPVPIRKLRPEE
jgi:hypothetical protein